MKFLIMLMATLSLNTFADEIKLYNSEIKTDDYEVYGSGNFEANQKLGRAWVELKFSSGDAESHSMTIRIKVPGLHFDTKTREVVLGTSSGRVICAKEKSFLGIKSLKESGECKLIQKKYTTTYDDGFEIKKIQHRNIYLQY